MHELVFLSGARAGEVIAIQGTVVMGRSPETNCEIPDPNASRKHAAFTDDGKTLLLSDMGSANGTWVNEERVSERYLQPGDIVRCGETRMRVQARAGRKRSTEPSHFDLTISRTDYDESVSLSVSMLAELPGRALDAAALQNRLKAVLWVSEALASLKQLDEIYGPVLETLFEVFPQAQRGFLLLGTSVDVLRPCAMRHRRAGETSEQLTVSRSLCQAAIERKSVVVYQEGGATDFAQGMSLVAFSIRCALVAPLMVQDEILGLLVLDTTDRTRAFSQDDMELAASVCRQVAAALKNANMAKQMAEDEERRRNLMRFLPKPVVEQALGGALDLKLGGQSYHGTVFFSDVVGFTRTSERLDPQEVVSLMNAYFDRMVPCIEVAGGAIDKFMGDAIMAFWGIPLPDAKSAQHAVQAALAMQNALIGFNAHQRIHGGISLDMGIGLNTGPVVAGNIGAQDRLEYTVLGDTVNTAQRIESRACHTQVLCHHSTWEACAGQIYGFAMPPMSAKNKAEPLTVYSVRGIGMTGDEILLHIPLSLGGQPAWFIRRLADRSLILVHRRDSELAQAEVCVEVPEAKGLLLGRLKLVEQLPAQAVDGGLVRSVVQLDDHSLAGLLGDKPLTCSLSWENMPRARPLG